MKNLGGITPTHPFMAALPDGKDIAHRKYMLQDIIQCLGSSTALDLLKLTEAMVHVAIVVYVRHVDSKVVVDRPIGRLVNRHGHDRGLVNDGQLLLVNDLQSVTRIGLQQSIPFWGRFA